MGGVLNGGVGNFSDESEDDDDISSDIEIDFWGLMGTVRSAVLYKLRLRRAQR